ncbi:MAG: DinB family protein [Bacteroidia bacterium]
MESSNNFLTDLNTYTYTVNSDMIRHLMQHQPENERIHVLISHTVTAHQIWLERIEGKRSGVKVFEIRPYNELLEQNSINFEQTKLYIETKDLNQVIQYVNTKRQRFENTISEMFLHLFNHATYHRGQINQLLVQEGKTAMVTDYIAYNRKEIL